MGFLLGFTFGTAFILVILAAILYYSNKNDEENIKRYNEEYKKHKKSHP